MKDNGKTVVHLTTKILLALQISNEKVKWWIRWLLPVLKMKYEAVPVKSLHPMENILTFCTGSEKFK